MSESISQKTKHTRDLRKGRFSEHGRTYLVTTVVQNRRPIFSEWMIGRLLVEELRTAEEAAWRNLSLGW